jgi:putative ABC transport system substrate-binding protein
MSAASNAKNVELFHDMLPWVRRIGVLSNPKDPVFAQAMLDEVLRAGRPIGIEIEPVVMIREPDELELAFTTLGKERVDAVVVQASLVSRPLADMAIKHHVPSASTTRAFPDIGGLMSFGADGPLRRFGMPPNLCRGFYRERSRKTYP